MNLRKKVGASTGLVVTLLLVLVLIGIFFYFAVLLLGGDRQAMNATDAGALNASRAMLAVSIPESSLAPELQGLGVNVPAAPANGNPSPSLVPGAPDSLPTGVGTNTQGTYDLLAYNRAAGAALLMAMNAAEEATPTAIQNATDVITGTGHCQGKGLQQFGLALGAALANSGINSAGTQNFLAQAFASAAGANNVNMLGPNSSSKLTGDLSFASVQTGVNGDPGKANIYVNSQTPNNDSFFIGAVNSAQDKSGSITSTQVPYTGAGQGYYQVGQPLLQAYNGIAVQLNDGSTMPPIYFCAVNPANTPHLIASDRFQSAAGQQYGYAPINALLGRTESAVNEMPNAGGSKNNLLVAAAAMVGALNNVYPAVIRHGWIRMQNGDDARVANNNNTFVGSNLTLANMGLENWVDGSNSPWNQEFYFGSGIYVHSTSVYDQEIPNAIGYGMVYQSAYDCSIHNSWGMLDDWATYDGSVGNDQYGHDPNLDPRQKFGPPPYSWVGDGNHNIATLDELLHVNGFLGLCNYSLANSNDDSDGICNSDSIPVYVAFYENNSLNGASQIPANQPITCAEAEKAFIATVWNKTTPEFPEFMQLFLGGYTTTGSEIANPSGCKIQPSRNAAYAVPTNMTSFLFCTNATPTPYQLFQQLYQNGASINPDDLSQYSDPTNVLGQLTQRCNEIVPGTTPAQVQALLQQLQLPMGADLYVYCPDDQGVLIANNAPPPWLQGTSEPTSPGSIAADGNPVKVQEANYSGSYPDGPMFNMFNAQIGGSSPDNFYNDPTNSSTNLLGDNNVHEAMFTTFKGTVSTDNFITWTPSSGANSNCLGNLFFGNEVNINGTFSSPQ
jgi:hypothetical protein